MVPSHSFPLFLVILLWEYLWADVLTTEPPARARIIFWQPISWTDLCILFSNILLYISRNICTHVLHICYLYSISSIFSSIRYSLCCLQECLYSSKHSRNFTVNSLSFTWDSQLTFFTMIFQGWNTYSFVLFIEVWVCIVLFICLFWSINVLNIAKTPHLKNAYVKLTSQLNW